MAKINRLIIYPQDIALITGRSERYGRMIIQRIKQELGKKSHQLITIAEYVGIDKYAIKKMLV